ncbi:5-carboxymethyl-2-hydroxymuconate semialdehyde dehydrogenase [Klugiella xanthotipulae]|uniref:5-carboxymethyl-2-hydroxymuconic-semialdehyde dehydrogenase n=1 Tax=Klugiella xanthotipulae TaxID=244735 RepID=A0A543HZ23_9MICO|nr:5-carboxymethyl-2-hydroxymuconate semialdehyde dehydrogenase [Klugiella xanthotipulae]TQM63520.1 5-carboxymethyl-2-hydroxymuconic-semialdehyde dehydrogenase [Klugiella xanthotipulae]
MAQHYIPENLPTHIQHYIGGKFVDSVNGATFDVLDPVSNQTYATAAAGQREDIALAVAAATTAFREGPWPRMKPRERFRVLNRIADAVEAQDARLAELETFDTGLPITQALGQAQRAAENFRFFADLIVAQRDDLYKVPGTQINYVNRKPIGVAGLITPWNTPFMLESWKLAPALASGCTVVLKPAEFTPLSASLWASIFAEAGLPEGAFNLVNGIGEEAGDALVKHPEVPLISFTGESSTGQLIFRNCAENLKGMSMELGGKSPAIVFADADLDAAIDSTLFGVFSLNGERCTAGSRILVERAVYDEFCERYAARAKNIVVGDPHDPATEVGALVHPEHYAKVMSYVEIGRTEGRLLAGGGRPENLPEGNYVSPTVFADVSPEARIFQEEIFGPVVAITPFDSDEEALRLANGVRYGLAAYVWTNDLKRAHTFAQAIDAGMVWLNSHNVRDLRTPFGGVKASGLGHEGGYRSIDFYTDQQAVHITLGAVHTARFGAASPAEPQKPGCAELAPRSPRIRYPPPRKRTIQ